MSENETIQPRKQPRYGALFDGLKKIGLITEDNKVSPHVRRARPNRRPLTQAKKAKLQSKQVA